MWKVFPTKGSFRGGIILEGNLQGKRIIFLGGESFLGEKLHGGNFSMRKFFSTGEEFSVGEFVRGGEFFRLQVPHI